MPQFTVRAEGAKVLAIVDHRAFMEVEPQVAEAIGRALIAKAKEAAEFRDRERLAIDGAILTRAGMPLTLSNRADVLEAVRNEAAWNTQLRRYMPGGVRATSLVGTPTVLKEKTP